MSDNALPPFVRQIIEELEPWRMLSPEECARLTAWIETLHPRIREYAEDLRPGVPALSRTWVSMALAMIPNGNLLAEAYLRVKKRLAYQEAITKWASDTPGSQKIDTPLTPLQQDILRALDGQALNEVEAIAEHAAKLYRKRTLGDSPRDTDAMKRIAQFFAKVVPEGLDQIRRIVEGPSTVNDKLLALEQLGVIGGEGGRIFSANELAYLLGVDPSTIKKTTYWRRLMAAKREHENQAVEESTRKHRDRAKITETFPSTGD